MVIGISKTLNFQTVLCHPKYDKRDDFDFDIVNFPLNFFDSDVPRAPSSCRVTLHDPQ